MKAQPLSRTVKSRLTRVLVSAAIAIAGVIALPSSASAAGWVCENHSIYSRANGKFVSAELSFTGDWNGLLRARADSVGPWERFRICWYMDGSPNQYVQYTIQSLANGKYVAAELGWSGSYNGMLRARTSASSPGATGPWEKFNFFRDPTWGTGRIRSLANGKLVSAELGYPCDLCGVLRARKDDPAGDWEALDLATPGW